MARQLLVLLEIDEKKDHFPRVLFPHFSCFAQFFLLESSASCPISVIFFLCFSWGTDVICKLLAGKGFLEHSSL